MSIILSHYSLNDYITARIIYIIKGIIPAMTKHSKKFRLINLNLLKLMKYDIERPSTCMQCILNKTPSKLRYYLFSFALHESP